MGFFRELNSLQKSYKRRSIKVEGWSRKIRNTSSIGSCTSYVEPLYTLVLYYNSQNRSDFFTIVCVDQELQNDGQTCLEIHCLLYPTWEILPEMRQNILYIEHCMVSFLIISCRTEIVFPALLSLIMDYKMMVKHH